MNQPNLKLPYNRQNWQTWLGDIFAQQMEFETQAERVEVDKEHIKSIHRFASVKLADGKNLAVLDIETRAGVQIARNRVGLRNLVEKFINHARYHGILAFYHNEDKMQTEYRLSFISSEPTIKEDGSFEIQTTAPKRFSYVLGENEKTKTPADRLKTIAGRYGTATLEDVKNAFSVETLTKEFYKELSDWYFWALENVAFPDDLDKEKLLKIEDEKKREVEEKKLTELRNSTSVIRLITRLMFVWFLKQKELIKDELFDTEELKNILNYNDKTGSTFYKAILQNLFFATLNTEMGKKRKFVNRQNGIQTLYRYERFFKNKERFFELTKDTPFLNGGLFENLDKENGMRIDCFSNRIDKELLLKVPDFLFFGEEQQVDLSKFYGTKGKTYKVRGLIDILKTYHFTIEENTPIDIEVALDPELLGKVFENLLASFNPETQTTARKQTGSFYTPREIVDYMVQESLKAYLQTITNYELEITNGEFQIDETMSEQQKIQIINALNDVKILDPACGSGAFPMGILQKMVQLLQKLDPQNKLWKQRQLDIAGKIEDTQAREVAIANIEEAFEENELDYGRKLFLIENCIFGIDVQPIAVQISKLRFFISLICEQTLKPEKPNLGIRPLPNLETKFVSANTLIGLDKPEQTNLFRTPEIIKKENELKDVRHKHFSARTPETKDKYREKDQILRYEIADILTRLGYAEDAAQKLALWNPYDQNASSTFFDVEWMFGLSDGFDIVIGNPPYVQLQKDGGKLAKLYQPYKYETFERTGDIYSLFYERGVQLLNDKGILCFITSNKWMRANYGTSTRQFLAEKTHPLLLIDFGTVQVFDTATVDTNIFLLRNKAKAKEYLNDTFNVVRIGADFKIDEQNIGEYVKSNYYNLTSIGHNAWIIGEKDTYNLKEFVSNQGKPLTDWDILINRGLVTACNEAFIIDSAKREELIAKDAKSVDIIKPVLKSGRNIEKWHPNYEDNYLIYIPWHFPLHNDLNIQGASSKAESEFKKQYPAIYNHLLSFKSQLLERNKEETGIRYEWYALQRYGSKYWQDFEKPKIIYLDITKFFPFVYDESEHFYILDRFFMMTGNHLLFLSCFFNSKLFYYCFADDFPELQGGSRKLQKIFFEKIPVKQISKDEEIPFDKIVTYLIALKKENLTEQTDQFIFIYFEQIANALIFELYFKEEFTSRNLHIAKHIAELPDLNEKEKPLHQLRKIYVSINQDNHPVKQSLFSMLSIPQIELVMNSVEI